MSRLAVAMRWDVILQWRQGFVLAGIVVTAFWIGITRFLPDADYTVWIPVFVLGNLTMTSFFFAAGLLSFEKVEGTLSALAVSPLSTRDYLLSKIVTLALLAVVETTVMVVVVVGLAFNAAPLLLGMLGSSLLYTLVGLIMMTRYRSISDFLIPSAGVMILALLPLLDYAGIVESRVFLLWPTQALLVGLRASFEPLSTAEVAYAIFYPLAWTWLLFRRATASIDAYAVRG